MSSDETTTATIGHDPLRRTNAARVDLGANVPMTPFLGELRGVASAGSDASSRLTIRNETAYRDTCRRGYEAMASQRVVITGLARDIAQQLHSSIGKIRALCSLFADARVVVFENDSRDDTKIVLREWAANDERVLAVCKDVGAPVNPPSRNLDRAARMAECRSICQQLVLDNFADFDFVLVTDFDAQGSCSLNGVANTFGHSGWDFVGANGLILRRTGLSLNALRHYDAWALRFDDAYTPLTTAAVGMLFFQPGESLVPVTSCFGGLGVYAMQAFAAGRYDGTDCEHVSFHRSIAAGGWSRQFLNPSQIVLHGRRWRTFDTYLRRVVGQHRMAG